MKNEKIISKLTAAGGIFFFFFSPQNYDKTIFLFLLCNSVEVLNPVESASKKSKKKKCIALYDFTAERESDLTIRTDDVIVILEDGDEWIKVCFLFFFENPSYLHFFIFFFLLKGELNGAEGFFPANYVRIYEDVVNTKYYFIRSFFSKKKLVSKKKLFFFSGFRSNVDNSKPSKGINSFLFIDL